MRKFFNRKRASPTPSTPTTAVDHHPHRRRPTAGQEEGHLDSQSIDSSTLSFITTPSSIIIPSSDPDPDQRIQDPLPANARESPRLDRRQVAFVSPDVTSLIARPPTPSTPQPSHPSLRPSSASVHTPGSSSSRAAMNYTNPSSFHHPPASVMSPHRPSTTNANWRPDTCAASQSGSQLGHASIIHPSPDSSREPGLDRITPTPNPTHRSTSPLSSLSLPFQVRRSSGVLIGPADTWGGNVIGGRLGEDIYQPMTWSEMTDLDLVENLSGRERTRQEVLWEIVASEERYVSELVSLRNNYITPLLYPMIAPVLLSPPPSSTHSNFFKSSNSTSSSSPMTLTPPTTASDFLPIAAQFVRRSSRCSRTSHSNHSQDQIPDIESEDSHVFLAQPVPQCGSTPTPQPLSPPDKPVSTHYRMSFNRFTIRPKRSSNPDSDAAVQAIQGAHLSQFNQSSASVPNPSNKASSTFRGIRQYLRPHNPPHKLQKAQQETIQAALTNHANFEYLLPESLKIIFNILNEGMFRGHEDLSVQLKEKYLEQFPLVRDLTSVWAEQSWIIQTYTVYVKHLERALREIEETLAIVGKKTSSAPKEKKHLASIIMQLEENAAIQGECGLAICLSKPFQRLLKYPLLFQNLLYHTDASTHEYESAQAMAISIDGIVRSIEDGKISEEERNKARDVWSRIEGINEKALMVPQSDRLLMSEEPIWQPVPGKEKRTLSDATECNRMSSPVSTCNVISPTGRREKSAVDRLRLLKGQKSFRRLSDMVGTDNKQPSLGSKRDIWLVVFSDVILRCQRVGVTRMSTSYPSWMKDNKHHSRRLLPGQERNLYKFVKIERWEKHASIVVKEANEAHACDMASSVTNPTPSNEDPAPIASGSQPERVALTSNGTDEYERFRRESAMSFSYDQDDPKPNIPNASKAIQSDQKVSSHPATPARLFGTNPAPNTRIVSPTTHSVIGKRAAAVNKFSNRVPATSQLQGLSGSLSACGSPAQRRISTGVSEVSHHVMATMPISQYRYETPTTSTLAKKTPAGGLSLAPRILSPSSNLKSQPHVSRRAGSTTGFQPPHHHSHIASSTGETVSTEINQNSNKSGNGGDHKRGSNANNTIHNTRSDHPSSSGVVIKKPSEDFSAFKSYFDSPGLSSLAIAFPTQT